MRIQIASDLHLEFGASIDQVLEPAKNPVDVLVIAGDLHVGLADTVKALIEISELFGQVPIVFVPGNHEFYHNHYRRLRGALGIESLSLRKMGIHLLDRASVMLPGKGEIVSFIGATGWTDGSYMKYERFLNYGMADLKVIVEFADANGGQMWGKEDIAYIERELGQTPAKARRRPKSKTVVVTHHAPTPLSLAEQYRGDIHNVFFINDWSPAIDTFKPDLWIHGHCHNSFDYELFETRVICNPCGYYRAGATENTRYQRSLVIEV